MNRASLQKIGRAYEEAHAMIGTVLHRDLLEEIPVDSDLYREVQSDLMTLWDRRCAIRSLAKHLKEAK